MLLRHELQQLAAALKTTPEFTKMTGLRKKIMGEPSLGRQMTSFEKEHMRILNMGLPEADAASKLKKLYTDYAGLLDSQHIKDYVKAVQEYQMMVSENIRYLNNLLDSGNTGR